MKQIKTEKEAIKWLVSCVMDLSGMEENRPIPKHDCAYHTDPEKGYCSFCYSWIDVLQIIDYQGRP
jgi:hypothetical protein